MKSIHLNHTIRGSTISTGLRKYPGWGGVTMKKVIAVCMAAAIAAPGAGCTAKPGDTVEATRKVSDQLLATYIPLRRLSYRNACGSEGVVTICVERISISDDTTLVEARIINASQSRYPLGNGSDDALILANDAGERLVWGSGKPGEYVKPGVVDMRFRMAGHFTGEPASLTMNAAGAGRGRAIMVRLGAGPSWKR
jgi:hypothetical protein